MRRSTWVVVAVLAVLVLLAAANPSSDDFVDWLRARGATETRSARGIDTIVATAVGSLARPVVRQSVRREGFVLFSRFRLRILGQDVRYLGVAGRFVRLSEFEAPRLDEPTRGATGAPTPGL